MLEPEFISPWEASFRGLDLAWEMGFCNDDDGTSIASSQRSSECQRPRLCPRRVHFAAQTEFYVGFEDSMNWTCQGIRELSTDWSTDEESWLEDDDASDEVSWMSAPNVPADHDRSPVPLNREVTRITDLPEVAHQDDDFMQVDDASSQYSASEAADSEMYEELEQEALVSPALRHPTLVYFLDYDPVNCRPRWTTSDVLHEDIVEESDMGPHDLLRVHVVGHPPEDLSLADIRPVIAQQPQDISEGSTFQMILMDVEFHNALPSLDPEVVRRVKLLPKTVSRKALLAVLGLQPYCTYARKQCLLWHNRNPVKVQQRALLDLRHGDYVRIAVPPARGELRKYYTREVAQCFRRGYRASNIPVLLEAFPAGYPVEDMPVYDTFSYIPRAEDLDYDRDALSLFQIESFSIPPFDPWPAFLSRCTQAEDGVLAFKASENDRAEPPSYEADTNLPPLVPGAQDALALRFGNEAGFLQDLRPLWEEFSAVEVEEEGRVLYVQTWYTDHERFPRCDSPRAVRLAANPWEWAERLAEAWDDRVDPDSIIDLHMIQPRPRSTSWTDDEAVPHILLLQHPRVDRRSIHIFSVDTSHPTVSAASFVTTAPFPLGKVDFYDILGIADRSMISSLVDCAVWHGDIELDHVQRYPNRHGASFVVILNHLRDIIHRAAASSSSTSFLQVASVKKTIELASCIEEEPTPTQESDMALQIKWAASPIAHPEFITIPSQASHEVVAAEMERWGLQIRAVLCKERNVAVCLDLKEEKDKAHDYVFVNLDVEDATDILMHSSSKLLGTHELMAMLYKLGFWRAVVQDVELIQPGLFKVQFRDQKVAPMARSPASSRTPVWPQQQPRRMKQSPYFFECADFDSAQLVDIGISNKDLRELFQSHEGALQYSFEGHELPDAIRHALQECDPSIPCEALDRLLIYADGSSMGFAKHMAPLRAEEEGVGDTWAYVILGERYQPPGLRFLGWSAQPVIYDEEHSFHLGAKRIGADIAEKEGLSWAALWRLSQNWDIPTCFRSDSRVALGQAEGSTGAAELDDTFAFLRGSFQALEAALGNDGILYDHVPGHSGEVWNELCDWLAKAERQKSLYCQRPSLCMTKWKKAISHLWLIFQQQPDLPRFCGHGFHAPAPDLPPPVPLSSSTSAHIGQCPRWHQVQFQLSVCTANVHSLCAHPEGHGGKIAFLRKQFLDFHMNFLGIQEAKTPEFCSTVDQVLRFSSGCHNQQQGVELWINLSQPYAYFNGKAQRFDKKDFQVVHKDSRILLVRVDTVFWNCWLLVAYAPHSRLPLSQREGWWQHLEEVTRHRTGSDPLIVMIDANAAPGCFDGKAVFAHDLRTSANTPFFRNFVAEQELFLPCTTSTHTGEINTWTDPSGSAQHCIDYVLLPKQLSHACKVSQVVTDFDLGMSNWDHEATAVELAWNVWSIASPQSSSATRGYDPLAISMATTKKILEGYRPHSWQTNIEEHVQGFNQYVLDGLRKECPQGRSQPKKPHLSDDLWCQRQTKLSIKKRLKGLGHRQREEQLRFIFSTWRTKRSDTLCIDPEHFMNYMSFLWISNLKLVASYKREAQVLRSQLRSAKTKAIQYKFENMAADTPASTILHELRPILGPSNLKKLKVSTLPHVRKANGEVCSLPNEAVETWLEFFRQMEGGERMDVAAQRQLWIQNLALFQQDQFCVDAADLPRLIDLEAAFRRINPAKAVGPDHLHPALCRAVPPLIARCTFSQLLKMILHGQEALEHKGGILHPLWKSKGPKDQCSAYRSILVSSFIGKSLHRSIRQRQSDLFGRFLQTEQLGGRPKVPVTLGVHLGRAFIRAKKRQGHSVAMLFVDLTEAFYRILRPLVLGGPVTDELIMHVGNRLGLSDDLLGDLYQHLSEPAAVHAAGLPGHVQNALRAIHTDTHFRVLGQGDVCRTRLGSRPGDCFADIIFSYLWGRILHRLQGILEDMHIVEKIPVEAGLRIVSTEAAFDQRSFLGPTWMDDTCICISDSSAVVLQQKIHQVTNQMLMLCESHGLSPNLSAGKTEVLLALQGAQSRQLKVKYFGPHSDKCLKIVGEQGVHKVQAVHHYTHLGCIIHHKSDTRKEARRRVGIAQQAFSQHRKYLLQNPSLSLRRRYELFRTLVMSRFCYGTESWTFTEERSKAYIHNALMRLYRRLLRRAHDDHLTDNDILVMLQAPSPTEVLRIARLRYIGTLYKCAQVVPWGLLNADEPWILLVADDLKWLWTQLQNSSTLPDPSISLAAWENIWHHHPSYWRRLVRRGAEHAIQQRKRHHQVEAFHQAFVPLLRQAQPLTFQDSAFTQPLRVEGEEEFHACMTCLSTFKSKGGLGAHLFKRHGVVSRLRLLFETTCCPHCMTEYHTFSKLHAHLRYSAGCRTSLWGRRQRFSPAAGTGSDADRLLCLAHDGILPPLVAEGPKQPDAPAVELPEFDLHLAEDIYLAILEKDEGANIETLVRQVIQAKVTTWAICSATLCYLLENLTESDVSALDIGDFDLKGVLRGLLCVQAWSFTSATPTCGAAITARVSLEEIEELCRSGAATAGDRAPFWEIPRPMGRERFLIHAFSGRRRDGDFQHFIDAAQSDHPDMTIFTISVDLMVDPIWGNVADEKVRSFWLQAIRQRQVIGALAGPPCETWSQARGRSLSEACGPQRQGPRVIRDIENLWGRASLALKELRQLDIGNLLLLFVLEMLLNLALTGGVGGLEHPAPPSDPELASIWRLPVLMHMMEWPEFNFIEVAQGLWGAKSRKPTGLLLLNLSQTVPALRRWQVATEIPSGTSIGLTSTGEWATSALKEYPPAFCAGLAEGFINTLHLHPVEKTDEIDQEFRRQALGMVITPQGQCIGPDFAH